MNDDDKEAKIKRNMAQIRKAGYPLIRDVKAENAVEIMAEILERKTANTDSLSVCECCH